MPSESAEKDANARQSAPFEVRVRRIHRRDINRVWEFLKTVFRDVNQETVEYQRPRTKHRFFETYQEDGIEQLVFEANDEIVGYAECAFEAVGEDNWVNPRYFEKRDMRPLFVEELAVHPDYQGRGVGGFMLDQLQHLARVRGCTHLVLEVAENNESALAWYRKRSFYKLDAAIFMAQKVEVEPELLPPRKITSRRRTEKDEGAVKAKDARASSPRKRATAPRKAAAAKKPRGKRREQLVVEVDAQPAASAEPEPVDPAGSAAPATEPEGTPEA